MASKKLIALLFVFLVLPITKVFAQEWQYPVIKGYGAAHPLPHAAVQPDKNLEYKIIFSITKNSKKDDPNEGLVHLARLINVYAEAGIQPDKMKLVAIITGQATYAALNDKAYKKQFKSDNPNTFLLKELKDKGHVKIFVCGQALTGMGYSPKDLNPAVTEAVSALSVLPTYELKGYALMPY